MKPEKLIRCVCLKGNKRCMVCVAELAIACRKKCQHTGKKKPQAQDVKKINRGKGLIRDWFALSRILN